MDLCILISFSFISSHTIRIYIKNLLLLVNFIIWSICCRIFRLDYDLKNEKERNDLKQRWIVWILYMKV